jgi:adenosylhomocysteine nucleosidase
MEGCAVAQVCEANGVPFVIIRSISDLANEEARIDIKKFILYAAYNSALIVKGMIKELSR